jgi:hypothetical protein
MTGAVPEPPAPSSMSALEFHFKRGPKIGNLGSYWKSHHSSFILRHAAGRDFMEAANGEAFEIVTTFPYWHLNCVP